MGGVTGVRGAHSRCSSRTLRVLGRGQLAVRRPRGAARSRATCTGDGEAGQTGRQMGADLTIGRFQLGLRGMSLMTRSLPRCGGGLFDYRSHHDVGRLSLSFNRARPSLPLLARARAGSKEKGSESSSSLSSPPSSSAVPVEGRWSVVFGIFMAFVLCNMDKVNMSVAIIPMAKQFGWNATQRGLISSSFFWGYALTQVPGGMLANRLNGKFVLAAGVALWSIGTALAPFTAAFSLPLLCLTRLLVGLGEGVAPPSATDVLARIVPRKERASAVGMVFGGLDVGSVLGLLVAEVLISRYGWQSVFITFALLGGVWCFDWNNRCLKKMRNIEKEQELVLKKATLMQSEKGGGALEQGGVMEAAPPPPLTSPSSDHASRVEGGVGRLSKRATTSIPWGEFFRSKHVWAIICAHFCFNWGYYSLLAWLPSFFEGCLGLNLAQSSALSILPYVCMSAMSAVVGPTADWLISVKKMPTTTVRKIAQGVGFGVPATMMLLIATVLPVVPGQATRSLCLIIETLLCFAFAFMTWSRAGLYCNHQDLSPNYAGILLGITNTAGAFPGIIGVWAVGYILDMTGSWATALFLPSVAISMFGLIVWLLFATGKKQAFDSM